MNSEIVNWISIIGSILSLIGVGIAIWQIRLVKKAAVAAKEAADQTQKTISQNLLLSNVHTCIKNLGEVQSFVRYERYEAALIRLTDLISNLNRIPESSENTGRNAQINLEETLAQLIIIREEFEAKVNKLSAKIVGFRVNNQLSKISDNLNKLLGKSVIVLEKDKDNE